MFAFIEVNAFTVLVRNISIVADTSVEPFFVETKTVYRTISDTNSTFIDVFTLFGVTVFIGCTGLEANRTTASKAAFGVGTFKALGAIVATSLAFIYIFDGSLELEIVQFYVSE